MDPVIRGSLQDSQDIRSERTLQFASRRGKRSIGLEPSGPASGTRRDHCQSSCTTRKPYPSKYGSPADVHTCVACSIRLLLS